ncbi:MAG TPA: hypothetical protein VMF91_04430 [Bryobacteraceae bacterium]|nr:hypothetical protein [Bryobacteraceae bacterium]
MQERLSSFWNRAEEGLRYDLPVRIRPGCRPADEQKSEFVGFGRESDSGKSFYGVSGQLLPLPCGGVAHAFCERFEEILELEFQRLNKDVLGRVAFRPGFFSAI